MSFSNSLVARALHLFGEAHDVEHGLRNAPGLGAPLAQRFGDAAGDGGDDAFAGAGDQHREHGRDALGPVDRPGDLRDVGRRPVEQQMGEHKGE
jgi:hypothetical protein